MPPRALVRGGMRHVTANKWGMDGFGPSSYGDAFADVYDEWYADLGDDDFVTMLAGLLPTRRARVLELGVGTGRLLSRLADARGTGHDELHGIDTSASMLARARSVDALSGAALTAGDFSESLPDGPFDLVFCGWNTLLNLPDDDAVARTFLLVAARLARAGCLAVDASLPAPGPAGDHVGIREIDAGRVVLSVSRHDPGSRRIIGQFVEFTNGVGAVLRPWSVRWVSVAELDAFAAAAGLETYSRHSDGLGTPFTDESTRHVSVWRRP